jgi:hypothetical protein
LLWHLTSTAAVRRGAFGPGLSLAHDLALSQANEEAHQVFSASAMAARA